MSGIKVAARLYDTNCSVFGGCLHCHLDAVPVVAAGSNARGFVGAPGVAPANSVVTNYHCSNSDVMVERRSGCEARNSALRL